MISQFDKLNDSSRNNYCAPTNLILIFNFFRILELYAEENSLDDTMYYLGEALRREKIELDVFLKVW